MDIFKVLFGEFFAFEYVLCWYIFKYLLSEFQSAMWICERMCVCISVVVTSHCLTCLLGLLFRYFAAPQTHRLICGQYYNNKINTPIIQYLNKITAHNGSSNIFIFVALDQSLTMYFLRHSLCMCVCLSFCLYASYEQRWIDGKCERKWDRDALGISVYFVWLPAQQFMFFQYDENEQHCMNSPCTITICSTLFINT